MDLSGCSIHLIEVLVQSQGAEAAPPSPLSLLRLPLHVLGMMHPHETMELAFQRR